MSDTFRETYLHVFHKLWGEATESPGYMKRPWNELWVQMDRAWKANNVAGAERILREARHLLQIQSQS